MYSILTSHLPGACPENREICALFHPLCHKIAQLCIIRCGICLLRLPIAIMTPYY